MSVSLADASTNYTYAVLASDGFYISRGFNDISVNSLSTLSTYDTTDAVAVTFDVSILNKKLGLIKDISNQYISDTSFVSSNGMFPTDSITISATEFSDNMTESQVTSVGSLSSLYSDFMTLVETYFGYGGGFSSLFSGSQTFTVNSGVFDASAFIEIINAVSDNGQGAYIDDLSGSITITDINQTLRFLVDSNVFSNRTPFVDVSASDPSYNYNYGVEDGFIEGDIIFVPSGFNITLNLDVSYETYSPTNNAGVEFTSSYISSTDYTSSSGYFSQTTTATTTNINRVVTAPLFITLKNFYT